MYCLNEFVDSMASQYGRRLSPRLSAVERLTILVNDYHSNYSEDERSAFISLILLRFDTTVSRAYSRHSMTLRSSRV